MTDFQKKEIWAFGLIAFGYILSVLLNILDNPAVQYDFDNSYALRPIPIYLPLLSIFTTLIVIGVIGIYYFYYLPKYYYPTQNTQRFGLTFITFIIVLVVLSFYEYSKMSTEWYREIYTKRISVSVAIRLALIKTMLFGLLLALYHFVKLKLSDYYNSIPIANRVKRELVHKTVSISLIVIISTIVLLFFKTYIHRVWMHSLIFLVPLYLLLFIIGVNYVIPKFYHDKKKFKLLLRIILFTLLFGIPLFVAFIENANFKNSSNEAVFILFILISIPIIWVFNRYFYDDVVKRLGELDDLQLQVDTTTANIDFLRSQINPHFLFNALNTLYGLSLTENADKTAEGIQKLGEMMRFMLTENQQEKVSIEKEVNYISNFIDLQKLRIQASDQIVISFKKYSHDCNHTIAPMLLIPLIENAFKHGISLSQPSWININLSCDHQKIYLDVYNSVHPKKENDTEQFSHGIGLANVKQRLSLLYPNKHELQIRNTPHEYIVHLTIEP